MLGTKQWIWPHVCCFCGSESKTERDLCEVCLHTLSWASLRCYICGLRLQKTLEHIICEKCDLQKPNFDRLCSVFSYDDPVIKLVRGLKFGRQLAFGKILGDFLADKIIEWYRNDNLPEALIPMPLYVSRLRKRGYNQALELTRPIIKKYKIPLLNACIRSRATLPQSGLNANARRKNTANAFKIIKNLYQTEHVAIVDDVVTTGSTVNALSKSLKNAGVSRVDVWCICRA